MKKIKFGLVLVILFSLLSLASCMDNEKTQGNIDSEISEIYQLYLNNGGNLSYEEWLSSIKGEKGDTGEQGPAGADGQTPFIGENGNWWIGDKDTGISAQGEQGPQGEKGDTGEQGPAGDNGQTPFIGENGNWWIGDKDTGISAQGEQGDTGEQGPAGDNGQTPFIGENGNWWIGDKDTGISAQGEKGDTGEQGPAGVNGQTPFIGDNGNWWIGDKDTGISAQGEQGPQGEKGDTGAQGVDGNGILRIEKTDTKDNVDIYTIYFTDGTTFEFTITNGKDGETSKSQGTFGLDYYPLDDGTLGVKVGKAQYLSSIEIPEEYEGIKVTQILDNAFESCSNLTSIEIPSSVTSIGSFAFRSCSKLSSVIFAEGSKLTSIGVSAFISCCELTNIEIPASVESIGSYAFGSCSSLESITIPYVGATPDGTSNTHFGYIFGASSYSYNDDYVPTTLKEVVITGGTSIDSSAFYSCNNLTSIEIPTSVTSIGDKAFYDCYRLVEVVNKSSLTIEKGSDSNGYIGYYALQIITDKISSKLYTYNDFVLYKESEDSIVLISYNGNATDIEVPLGVTSIRSNAFRYCSNLSSVTFAEGSKLTSIGNTAFYECSSLTSIEIPASVESIDRSAFNNCRNLSSVIFAEGSNLTSIGDNTFYSCSNLTSIEIPTSVTSIGDKAFYDCYRLVEVVNKSSLTIEKGSDSNGYIGYYALQIITDKISSKLYTYNDFLLYKESEDSIILISYNGNATDIVVPSGVTSINKIAFRYCSNLTSIEIPTSVTSIGDNAFRYCSNLTSIEIPASVTSIGGWAFIGCSSLKNVYYEGSIEEWCNIAFSKSDSNPMYSASHLYMKDSNNEWEEVTEIEIPNTITSIGDYQFYGFSNVTSITIPNSVTSVGSSAFKGCSSLVYNEYNNGYYLGNDTNPYFVLVKAKSKNITSCEINDNTKIIYYSAFKGCSSLTSITIPNSVTSIGGYAFEDCSSLKNVYYEGCIEEWCNITFSNYNSNPMYYASHLYMKDSNNEWEEVTEIEIPNTITSIGDYQFYGFSNVTSITIPNSVTSIGEDAFRYCSSLKNVYYEGSIEECCNIALSNFNSNPMYYASHLYMKDSNNEWEEVTEIEIPNTITSIGDYQFYGFSNVTSITIPNSVTSIGESGFKNCTNLTSVTFAEGSKLTSIEQYAFADCSNLTSITFAEGSKLTSIGECAFSNCTSLTSITIPESVTSIGDNAFSNCSNLNYNEFNNAYYLGNEDNPYLVLIKVLDTFITTFEVKSNTKVICDNAFNGCSSLTSITIPASVTSIGYGAFNGCSSLTSITIPESVTSIRYAAFNGCSSLTSIEIPASVTSIGNGAFYGCSSLTNIKYKGTKNQWQSIIKSNSWDSNTGSYTIHCNDGDISKKTLF